VTSAGRTQWSKHASGRRHLRWQRGDAGDTLIEILFAVVIISLTVAAVMGALTTTITGSAEHRQLATDDTLVKSFAESVKYQLQLRTSPAPAFENCSTSKTGSQVLSDYIITIPPWNSPIRGYPTGYQAHIVTDPAKGLEFWDASSKNFVFANAVATCAPNSADSSGIQRVTVQAIAPNGVTVALSVIVRDPNFGSNYCNVYKAAIGATCSP
jgi:type II secretory pathway pseudopilin PulG